MTRRISRLAVMAAMLVAVAGLSASGEDKKPVTPIQQIMKEGHAGKKSLLAQIKTGVKEEKWGEITKAAYKLRGYGDDLGKNKPEKGTEESWAILTKGYKQITEDIAAGVDKKDQKQANEAIATLGKSCKACHDQHKE